MVKTIGNPGTWLAGMVGGASAHAASAAAQLGATETGAPPEVLKISMSDLRDALRHGLEDFAALRTDVYFLCLLYPLMGLVMAVFAFNQNLLPLIFPLVSGFALVGPLAGIGLYEMSRRREQGLETSWVHALDVLRSPSFGPILVLGVYLLGVFLIWMVAARWIYALTLGPEAPVSTAAFLSDLVGTTAGWTMVVLGTGVGFVFATMVLAVSVVSFPLLLDRRVGLPQAVVTSLRVAQRNPVAIGAWGLIVGAGLVLGSIPFLLGLVLVLPVLGHATWHLYRCAVAKP